MEEAYVEVKTKGGMKDKECFGKWITQKLAMVEPESARLEPIQNLCAFSLSALQRIDR
jgi:hypothetical protein